MFCKWLRTPFLPNSVRQKNIANKSGLNYECKHKQKSMNKIYSTYFGKQIKLQVSECVNSQFILISLRQYAKVMMKTLQQITLCKLSPFIPFSKINSWATSISSVKVDLFVIF